MRQASTSVPGWVVGVWHHARPTKRRRARDHVFQKLESRDSRPKVLETVVHIIEKLTKLSSLCAAAVGNLANAPLSSLDSGSSHDDFDNIFSGTCTVHGLRREHHHGRHY